MNIYIYIYKNIYIHIQDNQFMIMYEFYYKCMVEKGVL